MTHRLSACRTAGLLALVLAPLAALAAPAAPAAEPETQTDPEAKALLEKVDDLYRGDASRATVTMHVKTRRYERTLKFESLSQGTDKALVRILEPAKERGVTTLKVGDNLWNYLPKVDRTIKVPAAMMSSAWMGSHFTNDDLVQESRMSEDYAIRVASRPEETNGRWILSLVPHPEAPVVWGRVEVVIDAESLLPVESTYYDEDGELVRTLTWSDVGELDGRKLPTTMTLVPADEPGEFTRLRYESLDLGAKLPPETFSLQALRH